MEISVQMQGKTTVIRGLADALPERLHKALLRSGEIIQRQMVQNLSGKRTAGNPYPGWVSGMLRRIQAVMPNQYSIAIGPGRQASAYAAIQEHGGTIYQTIAETRRVKLKDGWVTLAAGRQITINIPARPYLLPTWKQKREDVLTAIKQELVRS